MNMKTRETPKYIPCDFLVVKSDIQVRLENQGCRFSSQELLSKHEMDVNKPCKCGRPNNE